MTTDTKREPTAKWGDPRVQAVYDILCSDEEPANSAERWEGWIARRVVDALTAPATSIKAQAGDGWQMVPKVPTEPMWGELARDIVFWLYSHSAPHHGSKLHEFLRNLGRDIPDWLAKEIPDANVTPAKGTIAVVIYRAMLEAAPPAMKEDSHE